QIFKKENEVIRNFFDYMLANKSKIHIAVLNSDKEKVKSLLEKDRYIIDIPDKMGRTPLHLAAAYGYSGVIQILFDELFRKSPELDREEKVRELIRRKDKMGLSVLNCAIVGGDV